MMIEYLIDFMNLLFARMDRFLDLLENHWKEQDE